jgi:hypothetical protein
VEIYHKSYIRGKNFGVLNIQAAKKKRFFSSSSIFCLTNFCDKLQSISFNQKKQKENKDFFAQAFHQIYSFLI